MDEELARLIAEAAKLAQTGEQLSLVFARELAKVWRDADRALRVLVMDAREGSVSAALTATRATLLKAQVRDVLTAAGYDALIGAATETSATTLIQAALDRRSIEQIAAFQLATGSKLEALRQIAALDLLAQGDEVATSLWRSLAQHLFTTRPTSEILADLADALDESEGRIGTLFDTQVSIYGRQVEALATEDLGPNQPYLFAGPIDDKTREFCLERVGKVFTRAEIDAMDNDQLPNPFLTVGGWNCRHSFLAVESQALREMAGTGKRVGPISDDVARIRARQAAKREARKKKAA